MRCRSAVRGRLLQDYLSAPFASQLSAAPAGGKIAWVLNEQGARNIWVAAAPDYKGRRLTAYTGDDGQEIGEIAWSPDGHALVYTRGGDLSANVPNPRAVTPPPDLAIYSIGFDGGPPRKLANGGDAAVSPDNRTVAFLRGGQIWTTTLDGAKPEEAVHTRGRASELTWSPDGARLAFTDSRGDHSFIGVLTAATGGLAYLDPSVDFDGSPVWSPDGRSLAFLRQPSSSEIASVGPHRTAANPWSIRVADLTTKRTQAVFEAQPGQGSVFRAVSAPRQILWTADNRLVFPWEHDGWTHLYAVLATGISTPQLLTPGEFEVEHVTLSMNGQDVLYSSNQDDSDRRHLWRVPAAGGSPVAVTTGTGIEVQPADPGGGALAFLASGPAQVIHATIQTGNGTGNGAPRALAPDTVPSTFPHDWVTPQPVIFPASDGLPIHGQLFLPAGPPARHPAVVFVHGGSRRQMLLGGHSMEYYSNAYSFNQYLASQGFVVLSVNYRSGIGYGLNFREAMNYGNAGASEFNDVMGAGLYLGQRDDVDPQRIGIWGGSYGGYLTAMALARASDLFAAGVDMHGVHDWSIRPDRQLNALNADEMEEVERTALASSPLSDLSEWRSPVLLIHGDDDRTVTFSQTVRLVEGLRAQQVEFEQLILPNEIHEFLLHESWLKAYRAAADFLARRLGAEAGSGH